MTFLGGVVRNCSNPEMFCDSYCFVLGWSCLFCVCVFGRRGGGGRSFFGGCFFGVGSVFAQFGGEERFLFLYNVSKCPLIPAFPLFSSCTLCFC